MGGISPTICYSEWKFTAGALVQFARVWLVIFNCKVSLDHYVLHACIKVCIVSVTTLTCMHIIMWSFPNCGNFSYPLEGLFVAGLEAKWSAWESYPICPLSYTCNQFKSELTLYKFCIVFVYTDWITIKISCFPIGSAFPRAASQLLQSVRQQSSFVVHAACTWETWGE